MKTKEEKLKLIEQIKKTPIIQIACEKTGISRATYYRWRKSDRKFRESSEEALMDGVALVNDMAESQLISAVRDQNMTAIIFWLKNHHRDYKNKMELSGSVSTSRDLTHEEEEMIKNALLHAGITGNLQSNNDKNEPTK